jgi:membrane-bound metal-dependent hydrolase YbcI (DUF457 family)
MTGRTHATIGANTVWLAVLLGMVDQFSIVYIVIGAFVALLPDLDADDAYIHHIGGGAFNGYKNIAKHRTYFHSLIPVALLFFLSLIFLRQFHPLMPWIIALAYFSHIFLDGLNYPGVELLSPKKKRYHFIPKKFRVKNKGLIDSGLFITGILALLAFLMFHYMPIINQSISTIK